MTGDQPYHHGNLREALLDVALELSRDGGAKALSLRDVTRRVGVSPTAAYRHFADRDALVAAVAERIQDGMTGRMQEAAPQGTSPRDLLRAVGLGYIGFALAEPGWFDVAFGTIDVDPDGTTLPGPLLMLVTALDGLVASGELDAAARPGAEWPCWSAVHGFARLALHGPIGRLAPEEVHAAAARTVDTTIAGLLGPVTSPESPTAQESPSAPHSP